MIQLLDLEKQCIVHYRTNKDNCRFINEKDIFMAWRTNKYGTTDVTRTFVSDQKQSIKIFLLKFKGHIAVATTNINRDNTGNKIDKRARKFLEKVI